MIPLLLPLVGSIPWKVVGLVVGLVGLLALGYCVGVQDVKQAVTEQNARAKIESDGAKLSVDQCFDQGGRWDVVKAVCNR